MSLRQQAKLLGVSHSLLSRCLNGTRSWNPELKERYDNLVTTMVTSGDKTHVKYDGQTAHSYLAHSSSGLGHRPLKAEITGSNPVCATTQLLKIKIEL